jgi:hypothetical protein
VFRSIPCVDGVRNKPPLFVKAEPAVPGASIKQPYNLLCGVSEQSDKIRC